MAAHQFYLDRTGAAFIEAVIEPIKVPLATVSTPRDFERWTDQIIPPDLSYQLDDEQFTWDPVQDYEIVLNQIRYLLKNAGDVIIDYYQRGSVIFPWDIAGGIKVQYDHALFRLISLDGNDELGYKLPVQFRKGAQVFEHNLNSEFTFGILLLAHAAGLPIEATMFGEPLEYFNRGSDRFNDRGSAYSFNVNGRIYYFWTLDFLQGFKTGALWAGLDHRNYWRDLGELNYKTERWHRIRFE